MKFYSFQFLKDFHFHFHFPFGLALNNVRNSEIVFRKKSFGLVWLETTWNNNGSLR